MHNLIRLTQSNGKAIMIPAHAVCVIETMSPAERENDPKAFTGLWYRLERGVMAAILSDKVGFVSRLAGNPARIQLNTIDHKRILLDPSLITDAVETDEGTRLNLALHVNGAPVGYTVLESTEEILDLSGIEQPDTEVQDPSDVIIEGDE